MDELKSIKIENVDGTFSDEIPIGVNANNVTIDGSGNKLDKYIKNNNSNINSLKNETSSNKNNIEIQKNRIDNLSSLKEGSTTGDAELIDARISINGNNYVNVGEHIRKNEYNNLIKNSTDINVINSWSLGGFNAITGSFQPGKKLITTDYFYIGENIEYFILKINLDNYKQGKQGIQIGEWDINKKYTVIETLDLLSIKNNVNYNLSGVIEIPIYISRPQHYYKCCWSTETEEDAQEMLVNNPIEIYYKIKEDEDPFINWANINISSNFFHNYLGTNAENHLAKYKIDYSPKYPQVYMKIDSNVSLYSTNWGFNNLCLDRHKNVIQFFHYQNPISETHIAVLPENCYYLLHNWDFNKKDFITTQFIKSQENLPEYTKEEAGEYQGIILNNILPDEQFVKYKNLDKEVGKLDYVKDAELKKKLASPLKGKIINCFGDSITSIDYVRPCWNEIIAERTGCKINNYGISGTTLAHTDDRHLWDYAFKKLNAEDIGYVKDDSSTWSTGNCFCERFTKMDTNADIVVIMGRNQWQRSP